MEWNEPAGVTASAPGTPARDPRCVGRHLVTLALGLALIGASAARAAEPPATGPRPHLTLEAAQPIGPPGQARPDSVPPAAAAAVPELRGTDIEGKPLELATLLRGGPVLLDFWALWCKPCLKELPEIDRLQAAWGPRGLSVVAVNADSPVDLPRVRPFVRTSRFRFRVVTDPAGEVRRRFQVNTLPTTLLLAPNGEALWLNQGYRPGDEKKLDAALRRWFAAADSAR